ANRRPTGEHQRRMRTVEEYLAVRVSGRSSWELERLRIALVWTSCHLGGSRPWMVCPDCGRRCGVLYYTNFVRDELACRLCLRLTYPSTRETQFHRLIRRAQVLRHRLGGSTNLFNPPPGKPPRMHWRRFDRLFRQLVKVEGEFDAAVRVWATRT